MYRKSLIVWADVASPSPRVVSQAVIRFRDASDAEGTAEYDDEVERRRMSIVNHCYSLVVISSRTRVRYKCATTCVLLNSYLAKALFAPVVAADGRTC